jgi:hypothetical protein
MGTRTRALAVLLAMFSSMLLAVLSGPEVDNWWGIFAKVQFALTFGGAWLIIARLKCQACATRLSRDFPVGSLLALPFSVQPCKR